jgi:GAF domain-containing protein
MVQVQPLDLGIALIILGLAGVLLVWGLLRFVPRIQPSRRGFEQRITPVEVHQHQDAVFLVGVGGRIEHLNRAARTWFDLMDDDLPDLEHLARRVRPSDDFMEICAAEGQARFSINGKLVEGFSYEIPEPAQGMLVTLRRVKTNLSTAAQGEAVSGSILKVITDFSQNIASGRDLPGTLHLILVNVNRLVPSDVLEVKVVDVPSGRLTAYRFAGEDGADVVERVDSSQFGEYERILAAGQKALWIPDTHAPSAPAQFAADPGRMAPMRSYLGVPLIAGQEFIGPSKLACLCLKVLHAKTWKCWRWSSHRLR